MLTLTLSKSLAPPCCSILAAHLSLVSIPSQKLRPILIIARDGESSPDHGQIHGASLQHIHPIEEGFIFVVQPPEETDGILWRFVKLGHDDV